MCVCVGVCDYAAANPCLRKDSVIGNVAGVDM